MTMIRRLAPENPRPTATQQNAAPSPQPCKPPVDFSSGEPTEDGSRISQQIPDASERRSLDGAFGVRSL